MQSPRARVHQLKVGLAGKPQRVANHVTDRLAGSFSDSSDDLKLLFG
jgi:hypothetical protein